ncbi:trypsin-like serine peptidase [Streptomyces melanogenes]|uniref:trypsin-like serine peptidase n=1 Tax=Streptomyces melanogenes TaxID=67326 RepID=UPI001E46CA9C|nr:trypsin-like serine protease [Streptomyces melanogenes]
MASATDPGTRPGADTSSQGSATVTPKETRPRSSAAADMPTAEHILGAKSVGVIFSTQTDPTTGQMHAHKCSASVVESPGRNLILTAGHCAGGNAAFVPWYRAEYALDKQTYGYYRIAPADWFIDNRYVHNSKAAISDLDFAFARLAPNTSGKNAQDVVGANTLARTPGYNNDVTMVGYPSAKNNTPEDHGVRCPTRTEALPGFYQIQAKCRGMYGGVSGGPWFSKIDWTTGTGEIIGNVGGCNGGGNDANVDWLTYSPVHGDWFFKLYDEARANQHVEHGSTYQQPKLPYSMGSGDLWTHARLLASGEYTGDGKGDLIVVWTDGEVTLYTGDGNGGFTGERQMAAANATWKDVKSLTGGDFSGGSGSDLLVVWNSGEVRILPDVGSNGLGGGIKIADSGSIWKYADQVAGGNFGTANHVTDLLVRWSDGEVTDYTAVGDKGFGTEHQLRKADDAWRSATLVTAGDFTGGANWDTLIRWADGRVIQYQDTSPSGLGKEIQMAAPASIWTHDTVMTAGAYDANNWPDDLLIRWSDGETTLYTRTGNTFGDEHTLVQPR